MTRIFGAEKRFCLRNETQPHSTAGSIDQLLLVRRDQIEPVEGGWHTSGSGVPGPRERSTLALVIDPRFRHTPENESAALLLESGRLHPTNSSQFSVDLEARTWAVRLLCSRCVRATATATPMSGHSASAFAGLRKTATKVACFAESAAVVFPSDAAAAGCAKAARKTNAKPRKRLEKTRWTRANRGDGFVRERDPDRLRLSSFMKTIILINDSHCLENSCARKNSALAARLP